MKLLKITFILVLAVFLAGCTQTAPDADTQDDGQEQTMFLPPEGTPSVQVISPEDGGTIASTIVGVKVNMTNFRLAGIVAGRQNAENEGHIHATLDGTLKMQSINSFAFTGVEPGDHTLLIELVNNDYTPLNPPVAVTVRFRTE